MSKINLLTEKLGGMGLDEAVKPKAIIKSEEKKDGFGTAVILDIKPRRAFADVYNTRGYLGGDPKPELTYPKKHTPKQEVFYEKTRPLTKEARENPAKRDAIVKDLVKDPKKLTKDIRTYSLKEVGEKRGSGEDEIFMTSETKTFVERSAGVIEDKHPVSYLYNSKGEICEFDSMDAQKDIRNPTKYQIYINGQGHSGALSEFRSPSRKGAMTVGQEYYHDERNKEILRSSSPRNASIRAIRKDLELTPNAEKFDEVVNKGFDCKDRDMSIPEEKAEAKIDYLKDRNRRKEVHEFLLNETFNYDGASEVSDYEVSSEDDIDNLICAMSKTTCDSTSDSEDDFSSTAETDTDYDSSSSEITDSPFEDDRLPEDFSSSEEFSSEEETE